MDAQLKKGLVEVCVLAVLADEPSYGYQIISDLSEVIDISESTLYPILKRLESNKLLETYSQIYNGRQRKYYKLTTSGFKKIKEFIKEWDSIDLLFKFIKHKGGIL